MDGEVKSFNLDELIKYLRDCRELEGMERIKKIEVANAYHQGYCAAISGTIQILQASNYEAKKAGADHD